MQVVANNKQIAKLCKLVALAYQGPEIVTAKLQVKYPGRRVQLVSDGFLVAKEPRVLVALKGIGNIEEYASKKKLFDDNALVLSPFGIPGRTHKGLTRIAESLFQDIMVSVPNHQQLVIVGHSLGGGIGMLLGAFFANQGCKVQIYTFGSPKVGDNKFIRWLEPMVSCCSTNIEGDPIPSWPTLPEYAQRETCVHTLKRFEMSHFIKVPSGIEGISAMEIQTHSMLSYLLATNQAAKRSG